MWPTSNDTFKFSGMRGGAEILKFPIVCSVDFEISYCVFGDQVYFILVLPVAGYNVYFTI